MPISTLYPDNVSSPCAGQPTTAYLSVECLTIFILGRTGWGCLSGSCTSYSRIGTAAADRLDSRKSRLGRNCS